MNLDKVSGASPEEILEIWAHYHGDRVPYVGAAALAKDKYALLRERARRCAAV